MNKTRTIVNILFITFSVFFTYSISLLGKGNSVYYIIAILVTLIILGKVKFYPLTEHHMIPTLFSVSVYFALFLYFAQKDVEYSTITFLVEALFSSLWLTSWAYIKNKYSPIVLGYFKTENSKNLTNTKKFVFIEITPELDSEIGLDGIIYDEIVAKDDAARLYISEKGIKNIPVIELSTILQKTSGKIAMEHIGLCSFSDFTISPSYSMIKRFLDLIIVIIASPLILFFSILTAIGVLIDSRGPIIFTQLRTGKGDIPFKMYKFRSMVVESEKDGAKFADKNDTRITPFGKFIRKFRLDELPQFYNILKGEMSLIGPRPEQKVFTDKFNTQIPFYPYRHAVRPGITGWAQVSQGYAATVEQTEQKVEYDLYYIKNFSIWLDLLIVLKTIKTIFTGFGSR
ncbi:MAG: exopolysaccharide biosynthesis polyprenyl glycosylphosphotransferase [Spirochaetales bacterium]|nr:exopolysaccharide biosynthesis polyprenyl glycosylphosphotransferase [Spirochaetales bacterium]